MPTPFVTSVAPDEPRLARPLAKPNTACVADDLPPTPGSQCQVARRARLSIKFPLAFSVPFPPEAMPCPVHALSFVPLFWLLSLLLSLTLWTDSPRRRTAQSQSTHESLHHCGPGHLWMTTFDFTMGGIRMTDERRLKTTRRPFNRSKLPSVLRCSRSLSLLLVVPLAHGGLFRT